MDQLEVRAVMKCFHIKSLSLTEIKAELDFILGEFSPSYSIFKTWVAIHIQALRMQIAHVNQNGLKTKLF